MNVCQQLLNSFRSLVPLKADYGFYTFNAVDLIKMQALVIHHLLKMDLHHIHIKLSEHKIQCTMCNQMY